MLVDVKKEEHPLDGLWLHGRGYVLSNDMFSTELKKQTLIETGLKLQKVDDFWVPAKGKQPEYTWQELVEFALKILTSEMTRNICMTMWLKEMPKVNIKDIEPLELPIHEVKVARHLNLTASWVDYHNNTSSMLGKFKMYGVNTSEPVQGTWLHWVAFATQILACENTNRVCPEIFCKEVGFIC